MEMKLIFTQEEANAARKIIGELRTALEGTLNQDDESALWQCFKQSVRSGQVGRDIFGLNPLLQALQTASVAVEDTGLRRDGVVAILLCAYVTSLHMAGREKALRHLFS